MIRLTGVLLLVFLTGITSTLAQVSNTDSLTNEPLNTATNIIKGNTSKNIIVGSYAQIDYNQPVEKGVRHLGKLDVHRMITFLGYRFGDKVHFVSEIEFEHVKEVFIEQAFINYQFVPNLSFRAGLLLVPMGIINEYHEPPTYNGVERPNLEGKIIPTTWRELGAGFSGNIPDYSLKYQLYVINGFNGYDDQAVFRGTDGFRKGRQKAAESYMSSPNLATKIDYYGIMGLKLGLAGYFGKSQSRLLEGLERNSIEPAVTAADSSIVNIAMIGLDARYQYRGFNARGMIVNAGIGNTGQYNAFGNTDLGSRMFGYYVEAGYDILRFFDLNTNKKLDLFARYEKYDTHKEVENIVRNPAYDRTDITIGTGFTLAQGVVLKADYQIFRNADTSTDDKKQLNFGVGLWF